MKCTLVTLAAGKKKRFIAGSLIVPLGRNASNTVNATPTHANVTSSSSRENTTLRRVSVNGSYKNRSNVVAVVSHRGLTP